METSELVTCNIQDSNLRKYQDAPNFEASEMSPSIVDKTDRNVLSAISGSKLEHRLKCFPESNFQRTFLMQVFSYTNRSLSIASEHSKNVFHEKVGTALHAKSKFDTQTAKDGYMCSILLSCHTLAIERMITLPKFQPRIEAMFIEMLRIVDIPADYAIRFKHSIITVDAGFEFLSYTCKAKNGYASTMITDLPALQNEPSDLSIPVCRMKSSESQSLTGFCESSITLLDLPTSHHQTLHEFLIKVNSLPSNLKNFTMLLTKCEMTRFQILSHSALLYIDCTKLFISLFKEENSQAPMLALASSTRVIAVCNSALSLQSCSIHTNTVSPYIPLTIKELLKAQQSNGDELIANISLTTFTSLKDKQRIEGSLLIQYEYVMPVGVPVAIVSQAHTSAVHSLSFESNKSIGGTILRANPSDSQIKIHSSLSLLPITTVTSCQDYFEKCFDILTTMSPQCLLSCVSLYPTCNVCITTHDLVKRNSIIAVVQFKNLQLLSLSSNNVQLQTSRFSYLGMSKQHQKDLRVEVVNANPPPNHHICHKSPPSHNNSKRSIHERTINKVKKRASFPKRCLHRPDYHMYQKLLWSQLKGKKMNSISLRKGLMFCAVDLHSSLKYHCTERCSSYTTDSRCSLKAFAILQAIEESHGFGRRVALFRGGKPSTQKSDLSSAPSDNESDSDDGHAGAATSHEIPTSSHEASHSNGAMNLRPSSEAPPPLKMNSGVSQPGGETDRYVQSSQSSAALITKSSEQLLHSQGASNNCTKPLQNKQVLSMPSAAAAGNVGHQDSHNIVQPKLECYEDENKPLSLSICTHPQILEQAQEEISPVLATGQHDECVLIRPRYSNDAHQMHPQVLNIENHLAHCAIVVSCSIPVSNSMTEPGIVVFGANVESSVIALPDCQAQALTDHKRQLTALQQRLRGLVLLMRFRCDQISHLLQLSPNNLYINQLQVIRCALRDIVHEMHCIHHRWHVSQLRFQHIRPLLLHSNSQSSHTARLIELQQLSALHACHSLLYLQPRLEQVNRLLSELLSQLQQANAAAQELYAPPQPRANPQQARMLPALLPGPGNVMPFQAQVEEDNPSLTQIHSNSRS